MDYADIRTMSKFGTVYHNTCEFSLEELVSDSIDPPSQTNVFYELFLQDGDDELVDVPVLISNYREEDGNAPNTGYSVSNSW